MSQPDAGRPARVHEPTRVGPAAARRADWRGSALTGALAAAREAARSGVGRALAAPPPPDAAGVAAWASAELAVHHCLEEAIAALYPGASRPAADALIADLTSRDPAAAGLLTRALLAPDARTRYVFLEDLLAAITRQEG